MAGGGLESGSISLSVKLEPASEVQTPSLSESEAQGIKTENSLALPAPVKVEPIGQGRTEIDDKPFTKPKEELKTEPGEGTNTNLISCTANSDLSDPLKDALITTLSNLNSETCSMQYGFALPTAIVTCEGKRKARVFFDQGSQISYVGRSLVDELGLNTVSPISCKIIGANITEPTKDYDVVIMRIALGEDQVDCNLIIKEVPEYLVIHGLEAVVGELIKEGYVMADPDVKDIVRDLEVLIGCDLYYSFIHKYDQVRDCHLLLTSAGYMVSGPVGTKVLDDLEELSVCSLTIEEATGDLVSGEPNLSRLWDLDTIGIKESEFTLEEQLAQQMYTNTTVFQEGQYWVRLPLRENINKLPTNETRARACVRQLLDKLRKKPQHLEAYDAYIQQMLANRFIEDVPTDARMTGVHYLPHLAVFKDSISTPLRVVFNASSKSADNLSLNDCLLKGPNMTEKLADTLLIFRTKKYGISADISKAFLRIGLRECDRDYTRFLWSENPTDPVSPLRSLRFKSVLFGATSSPFLLQATIDHHLNLSSHPVAPRLMGLFYMDNMVGTADSGEEIKELYEAAKEIMVQGNFPLQQWATNNVPTRELMVTCNDPPEMELGVLGYVWAVDNDVLKVKRLEWPSLPMTKRNLLRLVSMTFDPLGLISPLTISGKILMQKAHLLGVGWDEDLPGPFQGEWEKILKELEDPSDIEFPRSTTSPVEPSLHVFCDASSKAYGAVAYVVTDESRILTSRARVCPIDSPTLPRLELLAILVAAKLLKYIVTTLKQVSFKSLVIWGDNEPSIQWVRNNQSGIVFVRNQVDKIRAIKSEYPFVLNYVPTKDNPADLLSRGTTKAKLANSRWRSGPEWLTNRESWPIQKDHVAVCELGTELAPKPLKPVAPQAFMDEKEVSSWPRLLKRTRSVQKAASVFAKRVISFNPTHYWFRKAQMEHFPLVIAVVRDNQRIALNQPSRCMVDQLGLYWDEEEELIRCRGRLEESGLPGEAKRPILLPNPSHITDLFVRYHHEEAFHDGVNGTLVSVRQQVWIPKGRPLVKRVVRRCESCIKKLRGTFDRPGPPPLPIERVTFHRAFANVGVDYSGFFTIKDPLDSSLLTKVYICLFTCMASRAVHLELARDLSAEVFLNLLTRFIYEHGIPSVIVSDNATNFVATEGALKNIQSAAEVESFTESRNIKWKFIHPRAPWEGGFYERLIGLVKKTLFKVMNKKRATWDELVTLLRGAQACVNNRPLTYINADDPLDEPLTPNHLIKGRRIEILPPTLVAPDDDPDYNDTNHLRKAYDRSQKLRERFKTVWTKNYLTALRERHRVPIVNQKLDLQPGDVVLVESEDSRDYWPLGRIIELLENDHGHVRAVKVRVKGSVYEKTINRLVPLEVNRRHVETKQPAINQFENAWEVMEQRETPPLDEVQEQPLSADEPKEKPKRGAAIKAMDKFRQWGEEGQI